MADSYNFFSGTQEDINRRLLRKIEAIEEEIVDLKELVNIAVDDFNDKIKALEDDENL